MFHGHILLFVFLLFCPARLQQEKFTGNLVPDDTQPSSGNKPEATDGASEMLPPVASDNLTEPRDSTVHVVQDTAPAASSQSTGEKVKKAPRPIGKAESVGFVPPPEKETDKEEVIEKVDTEKLVVNSIPTLPPRFATIYV